MSQAQTPTVPAYAPGVQALLEAEKEANRQVQLAHRVEKIKEARSEAASEIEALRAAKQEEFVVYEREILGSLQTGLHQVEQETEIKLEETKRLAKLKQDEVVKLLLCAVTECDPRRHWNFQPQREEGRIGEK